MNKIEEEIKEAIQESMDLNGCSLPIKDIEEIASEKAQEILQDIAVSSPDQLEVWVDGEKLDSEGRKEWAYILFENDADGVDVTVRRWHGPGDQNMMEFSSFNGNHIQLITPDGFVVMDNKKEE